jgi:hypothetical protein
MVLDSSIKRFMVSSINPRMSMCATIRGSGLRPPPVIPSE